MMIMKMMRMMTAPTTTMENNSAATYILKSIHNLEYPQERTVTPESLRTLHHPVSPLHPISRLFQSLPSRVRGLDLCLNHTASLLCNVFLWLLDMSLCLRQYRHYLLPQAPQTFHCKLQSHLFKNSLPDPSIQTPHFNLSCPQRTPSPITAVPPPLSGLSCNGTQFFIWYPSTTHLTGRSAQE